MRRTLVELGLLVVVGLVAGLAANAVNPDGVTLSHDYFEKSRDVATSRPRGVDSPSDPPHGGATTSPVDSHPTGSGAQGGGEDSRSDSGHTADLLPAEAAAMGFVREQGLDPLTHAEVVSHYENEASRLSGLILFIDARKEDHFLDSHIPGAFNLYAYRIVDYDPAHIDQIVGMTMAAETVIVYCNGGHCEDSVMTARELLERGSDPDRVHVYAAGFEAWLSAGRPIERGERDSGVIEQGGRP